MTKKPIKKPTPNLSRSTSVLIVDEHPAIRIGVSKILDEHDDIEIIGEVSDFSSLIDIVSQNDIDVVITQLGVDHADALRAIETISGLGRPTRIIVYSLCENENCVTDAIRSGASGYVSKRSDMHHLVEAVKYVARGGSYLDPALSPGVMDRLMNRKNSDSPDVKLLTDRETRVLNCVAEGQRNKEIARSLTVSERTVKYHIRAIFDKLGVSSRTEMVKIALKENLIRH